MADFLRAIFSTWEFRPEVLVIPILFATLYMRGWFYLRRVTSQRRARWYGIGRHETQSPLLQPWRPFAYMAGLIILVVALLSGLDAYASLLFFVHMIQHLLIIMIVPPLLWLGNPYPFIMWGLPRPLRLRMSALMATSAPFRVGLKRLTSPGLAWILLVATTWIWHDGQIYSLTLENSLIHDLEHISFFLAGMVFWWHAVGAAPHIHRPMSYLKRVAYVIAAIPPNMILGVAISFATTPLYPYYTTVPRIWGISVMEDQMIGGVIMWVPGSMMYLVAVLALVAIHLQSEEAKAPLPDTTWATEQAMLAPGLEGNGSKPVESR